MSGAIHCQEPVGGVALVEIDNPPRNAMTRAMLAAMTSAFGQIHADTAVRAVVLTGKGRAFCSGADLKEAASHFGRGEDLDSFGRALRAVEQCRVPVIAAIDGYCIGGGFELALCCDLRIASTDASFVCAGVNVGLMASTYRLPRLIGVSRAKAMLLTGLGHDATSMERWGLVTAVHAPDSLLEAAMKLAARIASRAPLSVEASKRVVDAALDLPPEQAQATLRTELAGLRNSEDHHEAVSAFNQKRQPTFHRR
jgi:enoyl-CoA hydratase